MPANKPLRRKMAYVEFLSCAAEVESLLAQGFSKMLVHERLTEEKRISMAYVTFCQIMQKIAKDAPRKPMQNKPESTIAHSSIAPPTAQSPQSSGPRIVNSAKESFPDPRKMSLEDGI